MFVEVGKSRKRGLGVLISSGIRPMPAWGSNPPRGILLPLPVVYPPAPVASPPTMSPVPGGGGGWWTPKPVTTNATALAQAQYLLQNNPGMLSQAQFAMLQAAGLIASGVPYSSAGQVQASGSSGAIDPNTGVAYATELAAAQAGTTSSTAAAPTSTFDIGAALQSPVAGLPLYLWLLIGGGLVFVMSGKRGR